MKFKLHTTGRNYNFIQSETFLQSINEETARNQSTDNMAMKKIFHKNYSNLYKASIHLSEKT